MSFSNVLSHKFHAAVSESSQILLSVARLRPRRRTCCPIELQGLDDVAVHPSGALHETDEPGERLFPGRKVLEVMEQQVYEEPRPYLPLHGVGVRAYEATSHGLVRLACEKVFRAVGLDLLAR